MGHSVVKEIHHLQHHPEKKIKLYQKLWTYFATSKDSQCLDEVHTRLFLSEVYNSLKNNTLYHFEDKEQTLNVWCQYFVHEVQGKSLSYDDFVNCLEELVFRHTEIKEIKKKLQEAQIVEPEKEIQLEKKPKSQTKIWGCQLPKEFVPYPCPIFGVSLEKLITKIPSSPSVVPYFFQITITYLTSTEALDSPGIFSTPPLQANIRKYMKQLDEGSELDFASDKCKYSDVIGLIQEFLQRLPEPLFPKFYDAVVHCIIEIHSHPEKQIKDDLKVEKQTNDKAENLFEEDENLDISSDIDLGSSLDSDSEEKKKPNPKIEKKKDSESEVSETQPKKKFSRPTQ